MSRWRRLTVNRAGQAPYLQVVAVALPIGLLLQGVLGSEPAVRGQSIPVVWSLCTFLVALLLWSAQGRTPAPRVALYPVLAVQVALWALVLFRMRGDQQGVNYSAVLAPALLIMIMWKTPTLQACALAARNLALSSVAVAVAFEVWTRIGAPAEPLDIGIRIPGINILIGGDHRWQGPFENPNYAGPIGALALIYLWNRKDWPSRVGAIGAGSMLILSGSRSAYLGTVVAVAIAVIFSQGPWLGRYSRRGRTLLVAGFLVFLALAVLVIDPTMNGRSSIFTHYVLLWLEFPIDGAGTQAIAERISQGVLDPWDVHGHNVFLDAFGRYGLAVGLLALVAVLGTVALGLEPAMQGNPVPLTVGASIAAMSLLDLPLGGWTYLGVQGLWLVIAGVMAATAYSASGRVLRAPDP